MKVGNSWSDDWHEHLQPLAFAYRVGQQQSSRMSPFQLMYGVVPRLPVELQKEVDACQECDPSIVSDSDVAQRVLVIAEHVSGQRAEAKANIGKSQAKAKKRYDMKHAGPTYKVGDSVLKFNRRRDTRMDDKLEARYTGPFVIHEEVGRGVYRLRNGDLVLKKCVNATNLKL